MTSYNCYEIKKLNMLSITFKYSATHNYINYSKISVCMNNIS